MRSSELPIAGPYLRDLLDQPAALRKTSNALDRQSLDDLPRRFRHKRFDRIVLTGMGSSFHACHSIAGTLAMTGYPVCHLETAELIHAQSGLLSPRTLLIAVSQSGQSTEVVRLLERIPAGCHLVGLTNQPDSPLARHARTSICTQAGTETSVACKTYLASIAALIWLTQSLQIPAPTPPAATQFNAVAGALESYLQRWDSHVRTLAELMGSSRRVYVTGRGSSLAAVGNAGLILKESAGCFAEGMSSPAFRHGPLEVLDNRTCVFILAGPESLASLNRSLYQDLLRFHPKTHLVDRQNPRPALQLPSVPDALLPLVELLPFQMLGLAIARMTGRDPGVFRRATKVTTKE
jgi:glutamine---fructose-6-phosphate transaminase (isomerizing)